jgi:Leucine-rich repeat (LRR) protein
MSILRGSNNVKILIKTVKFNINTFNVTFMIDRYKFHQFYSIEKPKVQYSSFQNIDNTIYEVEKLQTVSLAMDFPNGTTVKERREIEANWIEVLPKLKKVKSLSVRHRVKQDFFDAICNMPNLESLIFWSSNVEDISNIIKLTKLKHLKLWSFSQLTDISPIKALTGLTKLSIDNCFKVKNYEVIGKMTQLKGLELCGNSFAPRNLQINSLKPFEALKNLKHLDLSSASVTDKSYESILELINLERFDITVTIPKDIRERIKINHKKLQAGFFMDYDFEKKQFYPEKYW